MTLWSSTDSPNNFYCVPCKCTYGLAPDTLKVADGVAHCPTCNWHRTDGFNQKGPFTVSCIRCDARIGIAPGEKPYCTRLHQDTS